MVSTAEQILLVEDDQDVSTSLKVRLQAAGYDVMVEPSASGALNRLRGPQPCLVILDIQLPDMDGYSVCKQLRHLYTRKDVPVVMYTVLDDPENEARGLAAGADAYLSKEKDFPALLRTIEELLARS